MHWGWVIFGAREGERWEPHRWQIIQCGGKRGLVLLGRQEPRLAWGRVSREQGLEVGSDYLYLSPYFSVLDSYHGFNLDVEDPVIFREDAAGFGQTVVQFGGSR